jgi:hypothetical protein
MEIDEIFKLSKDTNDTDNIHLYDIFTSAGAIISTYEAGPKTTGPKKKKKLKIK